MPKTEPKFTIALKNRMYVILRDGKEDVRIIPCRSKDEAEKQLKKLLLRIGAKQ